eukprot:1362358-Prymnesium_polylepis.1
MPPIIPRPALTGTPHTGALASRTRGALAGYKKASRSMSMADVGNSRSNASSTSGCTGGVERLEHLRVHGAKPAHARGAGAARVSERGWVVGRGSCRVCERVQVSAGEAARAQ